MNSDSGMLLNSSIPFVLVGNDRYSPTSRIDAVVARGNGAGIEIVGFIRESEVTHSYLDSVTRNKFLLAMFRRKQFRIIRSSPTPPFHEALDQRSSRYALAWKGIAPVSLEIEEEFNRSLPDILIGLENKSPSEVEWALARVIFLIQKRENRLLLIGRLTWIYILLFMLLVILVPLLILRKII
jgi:hypothetical protein